MLFQSPSPLRWALAFLVGNLLITTAYTYTVQGIACHAVHLQHNNEDSPFCLAASSAMDLMQLQPPLNFLASQVWPSARVAAQALQIHMRPHLRVCELGCGPGLPSLTAAQLGAPRVVATDLDPFALQLVEAASQAQGWQDRVVTQPLDLMSANQDAIPPADLYLFSDVFESARVARGAAEVSRLVLEQSDEAKIWVFAQSDRACREDYLREMRTILKDPSLNWIPLEEYDDNQRLFLCDLDETKVSY
jgi:predicted nicotinamide N-methyase